MDAAELRIRCGAWTGVTHALKAEDELVFRVAGKSFAVLCLRGPERGRVSFRVDAEQFIEFCEQPGIVPAHYAARPFWVTLIEPERFSDERIEACLRRSYELVRTGLSRRQQATLAALEPVARARRPRSTNKA